MKGEINKMETSAIVLLISHYIPAPYLAIVALIGWGLSEALALIPQVKSNSVFQLIFNVFQSLFNKTNAQ
jgi:hypothetical protein